MTGPCPRCGAILGVVNTRIIGQTRVRYIGCHGCGFRPEGNKMVIPLVYAPPRVRAISSTVPTVTIGHKR